MNLKQEVSLFLDLYGTRKKLTYSENPTDNIAFYGNEVIMYNHTMIKQENTIPMLEVLEPENVSVKINELLEIYEALDWVTLDSFKWYANSNKTDYVAIWSKWLQLKKFKAIRKMLEDYENVTVKYADMFIFYAGGIPMIIAAPVQLDQQTSLLHDQLD